MQYKYTSPPRRCYRIKPAAHHCSTVSLSSSPRATCPSPASSRHQFQPQPPPRPAASGSRHHRPWHAFSPKNRHSPFPAATRTEMPTYRHPCSSTIFYDVRLRPSGRWAAEITRGVYRIWHQSLLPARMTPWCGGSMARAGQSTSAMCRVGRRRIS
jgi:hypothetical protein